MHDDPNAFYGAGLPVATYDLFAAMNPAVAGDVEFYVDTAVTEGGPVLELGVGTGRVATALAAADLEVVGLDLSAGMLALAEQKAKALPGEAQRRLRFVQGSMADFHLDQLFRLVLIPARAFQHLTDPSLQKAALACVHRHLVPGGLLVLDLFDPLLDACVAAPAELPPARRATDPVTQRTFRRRVLERSADPLRQIISERLVVEQLTAHDDVEIAEETSWTLRWSTRQETTWLLELCGFEPVACYSDFQRSPPVYGREQLWLTRRPTS